MKTAAYIVIGLLVFAFVLVQFGVLSGTRPTDIGVKGSRLKRPSLTPNSVSSQASLYPEHPQKTYAEIEPLPFKHDAAASSMEALTTVLQAMPGVTVVEIRQDYLYAQAQTRWLKFVDDMEFWVNPELGVIDVRSASRLGRKDFGVNRQRIEAIRSAYRARP